MPFCVTTLAKPSLVFSASAGAAATSAGGLGPGVKSSSSMSKPSIPAGAPGLPLYASSCGIQRRRFSPTTISCIPSVHPAMTRPSDSVAGSDLRPG